MFTAKKKYLQRTPAADDLQRTPTFVAGLCDELRLRWHARMAARRRKEGFRPDVSIEERLHARSRNGYLRRITYLRMS